MQPHAIEPGDDDITPLLVALTHLLIRRGAHLQGLNAGDLAHDRCAEHAILVHFHHRFTQRRGRAGIAETPASHGKGLAEAVQQNRAFPHSWILDDALVRAAIIKQLAVDLVSEDKQIMLHGERGDLLQLLWRHDATRRIGGEIQRDDLGLRRDGLLHVCRHQGKVVFLTCLDGHRHAVRHLDAGIVGHVAGLVINHLVPWIQHRAEGDVERLGHTDGDENLRLRIIGDVEKLLHILADKHAQRLQTEVGGVARLAFFQRADHRLTNRPGRGFIGLTDTERNDVRAADDEFKKVTNP